MDKKTALAFAEQVMESLSGKKAVGIFNSNLDDSDEIVIYGEDIDIKVLRVKRIDKNNPDNTIATNWYAAFDMSKNNSGEVVELEVPKTKEGLFAGSKQWQVKEWCKELNVKYIHVVSKE